MDIAIHIKQVEVEEPIGQFSRFYIATWMTGSNHYTHGTQGMADEPVAAVEDLINELAVVDQRQARINADDWEDD